MRLGVRDSGSPRNARKCVRLGVLDSGSEWFENTKGDKSRAGMLTLVIGGLEKWDYIKVIR